MAARQTRTAPPLPERQPPARPGTPGEPQYAVRVLDNAVNTYQEVIGVCAAVLAIPQEEAFRIAHTIDTAGSCVVCVAPKAEAQWVADAIGTIGIEVRLEPVGEGAPLPN